MTTTYVNVNSVMGTSIALPIIATISVGLRFLSRSSAKQGLGMDDWMSVPALLLTWGVAACLIHGSSLGIIGGHLYPEAARTAASRAAAIAQFSEQNKLDYAIMGLSAAAIGCIRLVVLFLCQRVFVGRVTQAVNWVLIGLVTAWTVAFVIANFAQCGSHSDALWNNTRQYEIYCTPTAMVQVAMTVSDVIMDLMVLAFPVYPVMKLQMRADRKLLVLSMFLLGAFATACGIVRAALLYAAYLGDYEFLGLPASDAIGINSVPEFWTMLEIGVACITSNLTAMPGVFKTEVFLKLRAWVSTSSLRPSVDSGNKIKELSSVESV